MIIVFWISVGVIFYVYAIYPLLLKVLTLFSRKRTRVLKAFPRITIAIAAYNEETVIGQRIENCLALDYPKDRLEIIVASDGSTDYTAEIVKGYSEQGVKLLDLSRRGKALADNALIEAATGEVIVTSSAGAVFSPNFLRKLASHFADSEVGTVTTAFGSSNETASETARTESKYWRYEMKIRQMESDLGILVTAGGACMGFRPEFFKPLEADSDTDNMVPLYTVDAGKRVVFEPGSVVRDEVIASPSEQLRSRVRQVTKSQRDILRHYPLLNPLKHPKTAFSLWSHKLLRWWCPFFAILALTSNAFLLDRSLYKVTILLQVGLYVAATTGVIGMKVGASMRRLTIAANFVVANLAFLLGTLNVIRGKQIHFWQRNP